MLTDEVKDQTVVSTPARHHKVGDGTPSTKVKAMWHEACFSAEKGNRGRILPNGRWVSLKQFARDLLKDGNELVSKWFSNKSGASDTKRTEEKMSKMAELASKSKSKK